MVVTEGEMKKREGGREGGREAVSRCRGLSKAREMATSVFLHILRSTGEVENKEKH